MEQPLICKKNKPKSVFEKNEVHYFYWPIEIGFGWFKVWKFRIPSLPIKFFDYEPIKVNKDGDKISISTRFHYRIFVFFNKLKLSSNKPVIDFSLGSHSPVALTELENAKMGSLHNLVSMHYLEREAFLALYAIFSNILDKKLKLEGCETKEYQIDKGKIPKELIFNPSNLGTLIFVGKFPTKEELGNAGFQV